MKVTISKYAEEYALTISGDDADIVSVMSVLRAGGDASPESILGPRAAANPKNVAILHRCLHSLYSKMITVTERFSELRKTTPNNAI